MGVYSIVVFCFFSSGISLILISICGIAVSSSPAVCGFSSFWLTVFGKRRSEKILHGISVPFICALLSNIDQYNCSTNHSKLNRLIKVNIFKTLDLMVNDYTIDDEIGRASNDWAFRSLYSLRSSNVFSQCLKLISGAYTLDMNKNARWIQL